VLLAVAVTYTLSSSFLQVVKTNKKHREKKMVFLILNENGIFIMLISKKINVVNILNLG